MNSKQFKTKVKEIKNFLIGKEIKLTITTKNGIESYSFKTLKNFGNKILELETLGAGFSISKVSNDFIQKRAVTENELSKCIKNGVWNKVFIHASTL